MDQPSRRHFYQLVARSRRGPILLNTRRLVFIGLSLVSGLLLSSPISTGVMDTASNPAQTIEPAAVIPSGFTEAQVAGGLVNPTAMTFAPDGRLFVCQQGGALRVIKNGALLSTPFVTVTVNSSGERGLLGVAFDPDFVNNNFVYVYYTATTPAIHNRVSRFTANGDVAAPSSEVVILELNNLSDSTYHNGGAIHFGDDGKLYIAVGENVNGANSQTLANLLGKVLRINPDGTIPSDNPFFNTATGNNRAIWALGLRNPFTFAFQPGTGRMFINDVGENTTEEINDGIEGSNYGWPDTEGPTSDPRFRGPIFSYGHGSSSTTGCAIAGAAFYNPRTPQFPTEFIGDYFFADLCSGWIRRFDTLTQTAMGFATNISNPVDLQVSSDGALYYLARGSGSNTGVVFKIEHTAPVATSVARGTATVSPNVAGASSKLTIKFQTSGTGQLNPGDEIIITLENDFQVTIPLNTGLIFMSANAVTGGGVANQVVGPDGVTVSLVGPENDQPEIRLIVPDMDTTGVGGQGIANNARVTIVFQQGSGITNPSEAGNYELFIKTTADVDALELDGPTGVNIRPRSRPRSR